MYTTYKASKWPSPALAISPLWRADVLTSQTLRKPQIPRQPFQLSKTSSPTTPCKIYPNIPPWRYTLICTMCWYKRAHLYTSSHRRIQAYTLQTCIKLPACGAASCRRRTVKSDRTWYALWHFIKCPDVSSSTNCLSTVVLKTPIIMRWLLINSLPYYHIMGSCISESPLITWVDFAIPTPLSVLVIYEIF